MYEYITYILQLSYKKKKCNKSLNETLRNVWVVFFVLFLNSHWVMLPGSHPVKPATIAMTSPV